jgi:hypothetical protein
VLEVLVGDESQGYLCDVQFLAFDQLQQQIEGAFEDGQANLIGRGSLLCQACVWRQQGAMGICLARARTDESASPIILWTLRFVQC